MDKKGIVEKIEKLAIPLLALEGLELVDIEFKKEGHGLVLRFYIDREGGVSLDTCSKASEVLDGMLDTEDLIASSYILEVSSPGIERPLKKPKDFEKFVGSKIFAKTRVKIEDRKHFTGIIKATSKNKFTIECENVTTDIPYSEVTNAHLVVDF